MAEKTPVCPECRSTDSYRFGYTATKKQRYQCKKCGRSFIRPEDHIRQPSGYTCPRCKSPEVILFGQTILTGGRRRQRLRCKKCGRNFYPPAEGEAEAES